jgi:hypothetical protein
MAGLAAALDDSRLEERLERSARQYDTSDADIVPTTSSGFIDADLLGDLITLGNIPLLVANLPVMKKLLRHLRGKVRQRLLLLGSLERDGYSNPSFVRKLERLDQVLEAQEANIRGYETALFRRQAHMQRVALSVTKRKLELLWKITRARARQVREHLSDKPKLRRYYMGLLAHRKWMAAPSRQQ